MSRAIIWHLLVFAALGGLLAGCAAPAPATPAAGQTPAGAAPAATVAIHAPQTLSAPSPSPAAPAAASPAAAVRAPSPAPAGARGEPRGQVVFAVDAAIAPAYLDPQDYPSVITPYYYAHMIHDALVKHLPGQPFAPSLAESYEIAPDYRGATFKLRPGIKFHNGDPVTPADVKFTYENYRGGSAKVLHDKLDRIELPDDRTVRFFFKEPFLDFLTLYGSTATGAGWIVPAKYYQQVGPDGFKKNPIGAGPYKLVRQVTGSEIELEAISDYWRKTPSVKTVIVRTIPDPATRLAAVQAGEVDFARGLPGPLVETIRSNPNTTLAAVLAPGVITLEFPGFEQPESLFHDARVRQAISLALDRQAISDADYNGFAPIMGNWIAEDVPGALKLPPTTQDVNKAKQLLAEAGYPDGIDVEQLTPTSPTFNPIAERVLTQLRQIGIRARLNSVDTSTAFTLLAQNQTPNRARGLFLESPGSAGDAANQIASSATCQGGRSPKCIPEVEARWRRYQASTDPDERGRIVSDIQQHLISNNAMVPIVRIVHFHVQGPRIANNPTEVWGAIPQFPALGPFEDIRLKAN